MSNCSFAAFAGDHYIHRSLTERLAPGSNNGSTICVSIMIRDNRIPDGRKTFNLTLTTVDPKVELGISNTLITILDDDGNH